MELCDGNLENLFMTHRPKINGPIFNKLIYQALVDTARGCGHIHSLGIIHFDIKTANLLYKRTADDQYIFKVSDFGVSLHQQNYLIHL